MEQHDNYKRHRSTICSVLYNLRTYVNIDIFRTFVEQKDELFMYTVLWQRFWQSCSSFYVQTINNLEELYENSALITPSLL